MSEEEVVAQVIALDHRGKSNTRRIEKLELQTEAIQKLAASVEVMVSELGHQRETTQRIEESIEKLDSKMDTKISELDGRLGTVEQKPAKRWDNVVDKIMLAVVGAIVLWILAKVGIS